MKLAFVFPGQGAQSVGMMNGFAGSAIVRDTFAEASDILGQDLWQLAQEGPEDAQAITTNTQPLMFTAGIAVWRAWQQASAIRPDYMAGHSLGEYTALVAAGALSMQEALPLIRFRAQVMQDAVPAGQGAMAAIIGLEDDAVRAVCREAAEGDVVEPANFNSPSQVVIGGHQVAVERAMALAKARGAKRALQLAMKTPSHCSLLKPAAEKLAARLQEVSIQAPQIPVLHNVDVQPHATADEIRHALASQVYSSVRWADTIRALEGLGVTNLVECAPGKVLAGMNKRIAAGMQVLAFTDMDALQQAAAALKG